MEDKERIMKLIEEIEKGEKEVKQESFEKFDALMTHVITAYINDVKPRVKKITEMQNSLEDSSSVIASLISMLNTEKMNVKHLEEECEKLRMTAAFERSRARRIGEENKKLRKTLKKEIDKYRKY